MWLLTPQNEPYSEMILAFLSMSSGYVGNGPISSPGSVYPTLYLNKNVKFTNGKGTELDPYFLEIDG